MEFQTPTLILFLAEEEKMDSGKSVAMPLLSRTSFGLSSARFGLTHTSPKRPHTNTALHHSSASSQIYERLKGLSIPPTQNNSEI